MTDKVILIADDDKAIRVVLSQALERAGYIVKLTGNIATLWQWVSDGIGDLVISDVIMPDGNGLDILPQVKKIRPDLKIIIMSAQNTLLTAVKATESGAFEYLPKPFDLNELVNIVGRALSNNASLNTVNNEIIADYGEMPLIGRSQAMQDVYRIIAKLTATDLTALITGESGTGKELIAKALHQFSKRKNGPFIAINMAAIPKELIESELFGHEKGAFTGAINRYAGKFEQAHGGTLFLDEIGDMPIEAQTRLLRVLQEGEYTTLGGRKPIHTDIRIITATNRDLKRLVANGSFREDLYYRLNVVPIHAPPLRARRDDIADLTQHFLKQAVDEGLAVKIISNDAMQCLKQAKWAGNVRELENLIRRLTVLYSQDIIEIDIIKAELAEQNQFLDNFSINFEDESLSNAIERHLRRFFEAHNDNLPVSGLYAKILHEMEKPLINLSLEATNGNQLRTAEMLGLNRNTLRKKIKELDISIMREKK